ncbi:MAG: hypothetical protein US49_C0004G0032 [candidate division TM6 bacterium GW2011_GWF2_37_49]|nr:MAG: hypothetical protein US49_C0004G0032 [candidate division TM6 bacterium GW2011_GWF2_37_49]
MATPNFKIVCIVQNIHDKSEQGLSCAFNKNVNTFIKKYLYEITDKKLHSKFGHQIQNKFLLFNSTKFIAKTNITNGCDWDVLFVCESIVLNDNYNFIFDENTLVMYHSTPHISNSLTINTIANKVIKKGKKGKHEPGNKNGYELLFDLTEAYEENQIDEEKYNKAKEKIIRWFDLNEKLNAVLEFLHESLGGSTIKKSILTKCGDKFNLNKDTYKDKSLSKWIDLLTPDEKYIDALADVRDALLSQPGVTGEN